jgi:hypothetical protein
MSAKSVEAPQWWSVPQAIVWIVSGSASSVEDARPLVTIASLKQLALLPISTGEGPPRSLNDARAELMRAARAEEIGISGQREDGVRELVSVPMLKASNLIDLNGLYECMPCIIKAKEPLQPDSGRHWLRLWIRADECMRRWPGLAPRRDASRRDAGAKPTKREVAKDWIRKTFPGGIIPPTVKNETLVADLFGATGVRMTEKTLRRAVQDIRQDPDK